jgi:RNA polymerase sigma factor for flagellar operon FliA
MAPLWEAFRRTGDTKVRERLIVTYLGFARVMAAKAYARRGSAEIEFGEYMQYASIGLLEAVDRFDPERGVLFESFAAVRITGAVLTGLESASEVSRQIAARKRVLSLRVASLNEAAPALTGPEALFARLADIALGLAVGFALEESNMYAHEEGAYSDNTYAALELKQLKGRVHAALDSLAPGQRRVMQSHYLQHMAFEDVAESMGLSRGRVSQLHSEALDKLQGLLKRKSEMDIYC